MKIQIYKTRNAQFSFRLIGANGEKIAQSEQYTTKRKCRETVVEYFPGRTIEDLTRKK